MFPRRPKCFLRSILGGRGPSYRIYGGGFGWTRPASSTPSSHDKASNVGRGIPAGIYAPSNRPVAIDTRLLDGSQDQVIADFKRATSDENDLSVRPDFGKMGREIALRTNYFAMTIPKGPFYQYGVETTPAVSSKRMRWRIFELAESTPSWKELLGGLVVHDHSAKLVSSTMLPQPLSIDVPFYNEGKDPPAEGSQESKKYNLTIKFDKELETESLKKFIAGDPQYRSHDIMPIISAFNLILAAWPTRSGGGGVIVGHNRFFMPNTSSAMRLGKGLEAFRGFYSSVRTAHNALMVNVDVSFTAFYKPGNLAVTLMNHMKILSRLPTFFKGLEVKTTHLGYRKTIQGITGYTAKTYVFNHAEFGDVSVEEYIFKKYKIQLKYPDLPLVDLGGPKANYLPAELCEIPPHQPYHGKLLDEHTTNMIRHATQPPNAIAHAIETQGFKELGFSQNVPTLSAFGVSISQEMTTVPGRIIPPPTIKYARELDPQSFNSDIASWILKDAKLFKGATLQDWTVLLIRDGDRTEFDGPSDPRLRRAVTGFIDACSKLGLKIMSPPTIVELHLPPLVKTDPGRKNALSVIRDILPRVFEKKPQLVFTILSNTDERIYSELKRVFDMTLDLPSVCVLAELLRIGGPRYCSSVGLKLNMKLGGINHVLNKASVSWLSEAPTMVVGIDVTHPGISSVKETPSVAAVVASVDRDCIHFPASLRIQESQKEMVTDLKDMMIERLKAFHAKSNEYPECILIYRDGVSEGQHATVVKEELPAIIQACEEIDPQYRPKLTIVVCVKNHHTRFFPTSDKDANEKFYSFPGTVVDQGVTPAPHFDFFLQANGSLRSMLRPVYYSVVHDEIGFTSDQLQAFTNNTSYMYARATKALGIATPAYYADLACERGRCYLHEMMHNNRGGIPGGSMAWGNAVDLWGSGPTGKVMKDIMFYL